MDLQKIKQMVEDGFAARKIARDLQLDFVEVQKIINDNNLKLINQTFKEDIIPKIIELYKQGVSAKQLGFKFGIDKRRIQKWASKEGVLRTLENSHRLKFIDEHALDVIDNQYKAYWLGFLYADAYHNEDLCCLNLTLKGADIGHIKKYVNFFKGEVKDINIGEVSFNEKKYSTCSYKIYSTHLSKKLKELGCPQAKSFILRFPDWLSEELQSHFIRGYFDGDGSIKVNKKTKEWRINICGTKEMCNEIKTIISNKLNISSSLDYISKTNNNTWILVISGNEQVNTFCEWMYFDREIHLDRKYERYLLLSQQQLNRKFNKQHKRENYLLTDEEKIKLLDDIRSNNFSRKQIAQKYKISTKTVSEIKYKKNIK